MLTQPSSAQIRFYNQHPEPADFYAEVVAGLGRKPPSIPPKFFYDAEGSRLFDAICDLPEYYPTRTEMRILTENAEEIAAQIGRRCLLIEPGSGSSRKVRLLLDALRPQAYMPMDISCEFLLRSARSLSRDYPWLAIHAACADFTAAVDLPTSLPDHHRVAFFPGSSIGNFEPEQAVEFLTNLRRLVGPGGGLLIGVDLKKDKAILDAAYNDSRGVTAAFNLNLLARINRELDADFDLEGFAHHAFYNEEEGRIEMHLVSRQDQRVSVDGETFFFATGSSIHTENSYKYHVSEFQELASRAGFEPCRCWTDEDRLFSLHFFVAS